MLEYQMDIVDVLLMYHTSLEGLSTEEAKKRQKEKGKNILKNKEKFRLLKIIANQFKDLFSWLLIGSAIISIIIDKSNYVDCILIISVVIFNALLGIIQEGKASKAIEKIKTLSTYDVSCLRDNKYQKIPSTELVYGDIVFLESGSYVPADLRIIEENDLQVIESSLTGESNPASKKSKKINDDVGLADQTNLLFTSTYILSGTAKAVVLRTGNNTEIGKIAHTIDKTNKEKTALSTSLDKVTKLIGIIVIGICIVIYILQLFITSNFLDSFKSAIALSVAAIPEGLQTVITMVLAMGALKLSKKKAIVKRMSASETLGSVSVIAFDKTGTITTGNICLHDALDIDLNSNDKIIEYAAYASVLESNNEINKLLLEKYNYSLVQYKKIPFDSKRKMESVIYKEKDYYISYTKGAFDIVIDSCTNAFSLKNYAIKLSKDSYRVLAVARKQSKNIDDLNEKKMELLGLLIFEDEIRPDIKDAIRKAKNANILPIMITGDHIETAIGIAKKIDLLNDNYLSYDHNMLESLSDEEIIKDIYKIQIYARVTPLDKLRIINLWQKVNVSIAMTGDGVNDAAALKKADIGIAMSNSTDITKDSCDIVLLDNRFDTMIEATKEGRQIYKNIKNTIRYLLSSNIGEVLTILVATLISIFDHNFAVPLLPIHLLWINLVTDTLPAIALGVNQSNQDLLKEYPRKKTDKLIGKSDLIKIIIEGISIGLLSILAYYIGVKKTGDISYAQTMAFSTICFLQLIHSYNIKNDSKINKKLFNNFTLNIAFSIGITLMSIPLIFFTNAFKTRQLSLIDLSICLTLSLTIFIISSIFNKFKKGQKHET